MKAWWELSLAIGVLAISGCGISGGGDVEPDANPAAVAAELEADFSQGKEARAWLSDPNHVMFETSKEATLELVNRLYAAGSPDVRITDGEALTEGDPRQIAATVAAKMPADPAQRKKLLEIEAEVYGEDVRPDEGEAYLFLSLD